MLRAGEPTGSIGAGKNEVDRIKFLRALGYDRIEIARDMGISLYRVRRIIAEEEIRPSWPKWTERDLKVVEKYVGFDAGWMKRDYKSLRGKLEGAYPILSIYNECNKAYSKNLADIIKEMRDNCFTRKEIARRLRLKLSRVKYVLSIHRAPRVINRLDKAELEALKAFIKKNRKATVGEAYKHFKGIISREWLDHSFHKLRRTV